MAGMQISQQSCGFRGDVPKKNKETSVTKGTIVAGAVGAGVGSTMEICAQRHFLEKAKDLKTKGYCELPITKNKEINKKIEEFIMNGKYNWKYIIKHGAVGMAIAGGIYLAYRGIKSLFTK